MWQPSETYPDPAIEVLDSRFLKYRIGNAAVERLATGLRYGEGPVWFGDGRCLLWSDIPNNRLLRWDEESGAVSIYRSHAGHPNGNTRDRQGRLLTCEHGGRRVVRTEYDRTLTVLADRYEGRRLNSHNDIVVKSARNIPGVVTSPAKLINVYDLLNAKTLVIDKDALAVIEEVFA